MLALKRAFCFALHTDTTFKSCKYDNDNGELCETTQRDTNAITPAHVVSAPVLSLLFYARRRRLVC